MRRLFSRIINAPVLRTWLQLSVACLLLVFMVGAGDSTARYNSVGNKMICVCGACGETVVGCNHLGCSYSTQMRAELLAAISHGDSDNLILQEFVQKYGPTVLVAPPKTGFNLVAWIMPGVIFLLATLGTALLIRKWKLHTVAMPKEIATDPHTDAIRAKIRRETEI